MASGTPLAQRLDERIRDELAPATARAIHATQGRPHPEWLDSAAEALAKRLDVSAPTQPKPNWGRA